ncbi:MAG: redoxin family protein [Gammaproteobacteria bacterium]|nr:redoxin family protein [Gammaproteobacteria bacterium]
MATNRSHAPEFPAGLEWFNVDGPVKLAEQAGRVVLIYFGALSSGYRPCSLSDLQYLKRKYRYDLVIIGVNSPRFRAEMSSTHVQKIINKYRVTCPVLHDPALKLCNAYGIQGTPAYVLIDRGGCILGAMSGEGKSSQLEQVIKHQIGKHEDIHASSQSCIKPRLSPETDGVLSFPGRIIVSDNKTYIADSGHNRILVTSSSGCVQRQYGSEAPGFIDGNGDSAAFNNPQGMALADEFLYVADEGNHAIRRINLRTDDIDTIAGNGIPGQKIFSTSADPKSVSLNSPCDLVLENGMLYIAMAGRHQIWRLSLVRNSIEIFSGTGKKGLVDGPPGAAEFAQPTGLTILGGNLFTVDAESSAIRRVNMYTGAVDTVVGEGLFIYGENDGIGQSARLQYPLDIQADPCHRMLWVADSYNNKIRRIGVDSKYVSTMQLDCRLDEPGGLAFHNDTLYIANTNAHEIICLNPNNGHAEALNVSEEFVEI